MLLLETRNNSEVFEFMTLPKEVKERALQLASEGNSAEKVANILEKEFPKDYPSSRTVRIWVEKERQRKEEESDSLVADVRGEHLAEIYGHDRKVFKKSNIILDEERLETFFNRLLVGGRYYLIEVDMLLKYLRFFDRESNKYITFEIRYLCEQFCKIIENLYHLISIHSDAVVQWEEGLGTKYKLVPGGNFERFYKELTNDHTRVRAETRLSDKADRLVYKCRDAYREYRSIVRETLYL